MPWKSFKGVEFQHSQASSSWPDEPQQSQQPNEPQRVPLTDDRDDEVVVGDLQIQDKLNVQILCLFHFSILFDIYFFSYDAYIILLIIFFYIF